MKCWSCKRAINRGPEHKKAIATYQQADGSFKVFGWDRPDGPLREFGGQPTGRLVRIQHYKCFMVASKRELRAGDAIKGRIGGISGEEVPTAYEIIAMAANQDELDQLGMTQEEFLAETTRRFAERASEVRQLAIQTGMGSDNWNFKEWLRAQEHGGPYDHEHTARLEDFQVTKHLEYAHGVQPADTEAGKRTQHDQLHVESLARTALAKTRASRSADPGYVEPHESDWRDQQVLDVGDVPVVGAPEDLTPIPGASGERLSVEDL